MESNGLSRYTVSFGLSLVVASVANGLLVVAKEKIPAVMAGMQKLTGHHWISHAVIILGLFAFFGWLFAQSKGGQGIKMNTNRFVAVLVSGVVAGGVIIVGFYLIGD